MNLNTIPHPKLTKNYLNNIKIILNDSLFFFI
ncbi:MAG: hypothetical protein RP166_7800 [Rapeseed phyllody phytoplasma]|uniref:Uncharacterized protein n=1 Tax=Rapeseed phyllody phytoplasma TaxID=2490543 RepID=A0A859ICA4_9MOLU|nr:MAG: hypothetical protein RP166_7800 [Rapeseed phyllody phytoplasma]